MEKQTKGYSMIQLLPTNKEDCLKELQKHKNHKWLFLILDGDLINGIKSFLKKISEKRLLIIDGNKEFEAYMGKDRLDWRKFVNLTGMDGEQVNIQDMTITTKQGEKLEVSFLYAGMELKEVEEHYQKFLDKARDILKKGED